MKTPFITLLAITSLLVGCNKSVENASQKFNEMPPAVQKTVRAQAPNAEIADVNKTTENGMEVYQVEIREPGATSNSKMTVAMDGKLLTSDLPRPAGAIQRALTPTGATGTKFSSLPEKAQKTIQAQAPNAEIANISRSEKDGRVIYTVEFREPGKNPTIEVAEDGTLVQTLQK